MPDFQVPLIYPALSPPYEVVLEETIGQLEKNKGLYEWETEVKVGTKTLVFPPHAAKVPPADQRENIFDPNALAQTFYALRDQCAPLSPISICRLAPDADMPKDFDELIKRNEELRLEDPKQQNMLFDSNIGMLPVISSFRRAVQRNILPPGDRADRDWYTDAVFAQQHFTGTNPTTITLAKDWTSAFLDSASAAGNADVVKLLRSVHANSLYVQDYSYFRSAMGFGPNQDLTSGTGRYGCAPVALFHLTDEGHLHPIAIVLDYKGSMPDSIVIFNKRLAPKSSTLGQEKEDWPWRYAKMCVQSADWLRHEVAIHLVNTHLVEEAVIVAAHRTLPPKHVVYHLLEKHWDTTLPLNALARTSLVPGVIAPLAGVPPGQLIRYLNNAYATFDWHALHVPADLAGRGFPPASLADSPKFHNYAYARNVVCMWDVIRAFVASVLEVYYKAGDAHVAADPHLAAFCTEMRSAHGANLTSFPQIKTLHELIDAVTMCIHIASPQHTAVNYLQHYYQVFVANKPWALYTPLPKTLEELNGYKQADVFDALPFRVTRDWLVGAQLPYLLSFEVVGSSSLLTYASTQARSYNAVVARAARTLEAELKRLQGVFRKHSKEMDDQKGEGYMVMDPEMTAVSILI
ncbi:hypothetical protein HGRIS_007271 [Hohenbuehelia grisea]|uniref:Manganese lipoxygenase n=1 Tax=Hohenbuehelia grisea TaxID=104357 RepID=A0ABR3JBK6_9AGAR